MIEESDIKSLEERFDLRYKLLADCNTDMDDLKREHTQLFVDIASIKKTVESLQWIARTTLGAVIAAIVGLVIALVK
jgi:hypothetical protein